MSHTTLACGDPYLKRFFLPHEGSIHMVLECQRTSGHSGEHAALWVSGPVTWRYGA